MKYIDRCGISNRNDGLSTLTATAFRSAAIGVGIAFATGCIGACTIAAFGTAAIGIGITLAACRRCTFARAAFYARATVGIGIAFAACRRTLAIETFAAAAVGIGIAFAARCRRALVVAALHATTTIGVGIAFAIASPRDASTCKHRKYRQYEHHELSFHRSLLIEQKRFSEQEYPKR